MITEDPLTFLVLLIKTPAELANGNENELQYTAKDVQSMMKSPKAYYLGDELNRRKIRCFIDKYVTRLYGSSHIQSWATKYKNRTIFDLIKISDLAYTVAVIENSHEIWEQYNEGQSISSRIGREGWERDQEESPTKKTPMFTK